MDQKVKCDDVLQTQCIPNINLAIKQEEPDVTNYNLEQLHHSIDIKDEEFLPQEAPPDEECEAKIASGKQVRFTCEVCDSTFSRKANLKSHMMTHTGVKPFVCEICDFKCSRNGTFIDHLKSHSYDDSFVCETCDFKCANKRSLNEHIARKHSRSSEKSFACGVCTYKSRFEPDLKRHLKIHRSVKPFACDICDYRCIMNSSLVAHKRTHTG